MKQHEFKPDKDIKDLLDQYQPDFKDFFETRVMGKITQVQEQSYELLFNRAFQRVTMYSVAALIAIIATIAISDGSFSTDTLMGISNLDMESMTAMTISGY
jgi:hypothetical protein